MNKKTILIVIAVTILLAGALIFYEFKKARYIDSQKRQTISVDSVSQVWYKNTIIYTLDVEVFKDSDGDGVGDFKGLTSKLNYLDSLHVETIWLSPFQPTPNKDDGYDITDFYAVDKRLGTMAEFDAFMSQASKKGFKVIIDLVVNHTSDEHPWFKSARDKASDFRSWYVWSHDRPENIETGMVFPGVQKTTWTLDSVSGEYYYHRFYECQPDLNMQYEPVQNEVKKIIKFWMGHGVDGFRIDAVPFMIEVPQTKGEEFEHQFDILTDMRAYVESIDKNAVLLGEANVLPKESKDYFGDGGSGMHMMFNFFVNQYLFYALATGNAAPLDDALRSTASIPKTSEWGQFLRNHDEVDLGRLSKKERQEVYDAFGPSKNMQLYDRGIRRRLAPMLKGDRKRLELAYSLLFALPSTPVIRYGDEIGMGDDLSLKERMAVRTPMQWTAGVSAGFSTNKRTVQPVIENGDFAYRSVNVSSEEKEENSLLNWTIKTVTIRKACPEISYGTWELLETNSKNIIAIEYSWNGSKLIVIHNLSDRVVDAKIKLGGGGDLTMHDLYTDKKVNSVDGNLTLSMEEYGYFWFKTK